MTEKLKHLLHDQAESVDFTVPDVHALTAAGDRTVRRRRGALAGAAAALVVVGAVVVPQLLSGSEKTAPEPSEPFPTQPRDLGPMFTVGPRVYDDGTIVRVDHWVEQAARTRLGFVYRSMDVAYSYVDGEVTQVGRDENLFLTSDQDGVLAGWLEFGPDEVDLVVLDQRTNETRRLPLEPPAQQWRTDLADIEGGTAYVHDRRGTVAIDIATGESDALDMGTIVDVENGLIAAYPDDDASDLSFFGSGDAPVTTEAGDLGVLSPSGAWYAADDIFEWRSAGRAVGVIDTATGRRVGLDTGAGPRDMVIVTGWLNERTVAVRHVPARPADAPRLLTCEVPSGRCQVAVDDLDAVPARPGVGTSFPGGGAPG